MLQGFFFICYLVVQTMYSTDTIELVSTNLLLGHMTYPTLQYNLIQKFFVMHHLPCSAMQCKLNIFLQIHHESSNELKYYSQLILINIKWVPFLTTIAILFVFANIYYHKETGNKKIKIYLWFTDRNDQLYSPKHHLVGSCFSIWT